MSSYCYKIVFVKAGYLFFPKYSTKPAIISVQIFYKNINSALEFFC